MQGRGQDRERPAQARRAGGGGAREEAAFLAPLPLRALPGLGPAAERRLQGLGLRRIGDLAALPAEVVAARLGNQGAGLQQLARGIDPRPVVVPGLPKSISREITFERDVADRERLRQVARDLAHDIGASLRRHALVARTVRLKLRFGDFETHTAQTTLAVATDIGAELAHTAEDLLAAAANDPRAVRLIGVGAASLQETVLELLLDVDRGRQRSLDQSLDRLRQRFGMGAIRQGTVGPRRQLDLEARGTWRRGFERTRPVTRPAPGSLPADGGYLALTAFFVAFLIVSDIIAVKLVPVAIGPLRRWCLPVSSPTRSPFWPPTS